MPLIVKMHQNKLSTAPDQLSKLHTADQIVTIPLILSTAASGITLRIMSLNPYPAIILIDRRLLLAN